MKEHSLLCITPMVQAILDGRKTQTRRIIKKQPPKNALSAILSFANDIWWDFWGHDRNAIHRTKCPYGKIGDRLWVRETFCIGRIDETDRENPLDRKLFIDQGTDQHSYFIYKQWCIEQFIPTDDIAWTPSIFMPRIAARILLEITNIRVERLTEISVEDSLAEGIQHRTMNCPRHEYFQLWNSIHGEMAYEINPWVWVITFKKLKVGPYEISTD